MEKKQHVPLGDVLKPKLAPNMLPSVMLEYMKQQATLQAQYATQRAKIEQPEV